MQYLSTIISIIAFLIILFIFGLIWLWGQISAKMQADQTDNSIIKPTISHSLLDIIIAGILGFMISVLLVKLLKEFNGIIGLFVFFIVLWERTKKRFNPSIKQFTIAFTFLIIAVIILKILTGLSLF